MADIIRYDQGFRYDEGHFYDQPPTLPLPKKKGIKNMADYIPRAKGAYNDWLLNLKTELPTEGLLFSLPAGDITAAVTKCTAQLALAAATLAAESALAAARQAEKDGRSETDEFLRDKVGDWKEMPNFTAANAQKLRLSGTAGDVNPDTYKPEFTVKIVGGEPRIDWKKKGATAVHIYGRLRGQANWVLLGMDTSSPYIDGRPLAVPGVAEVREYMLRGLIDDQEIGLDSDILSVTWGGQ